MSVNKKLLIVEDEEALLDPLTKNFANKGFEVYRALNGKEGLDIALRLKHDIDMILLDLNMPVLGGIPMLKMLRDDPKGKELKVIILTNLYDEDLVGQTAELGIIEYIVKSDWKLNDIVTRISKHLGVSDEAGA